jgi:hypothetical protein
MHSYGKILHAKLMILRGERRVRREDGSENRMKEGGRDGKREGGMKRRREGG